MARRRKPESFQRVYNHDGTCSMWNCGKEGVVLAYIDYAPEIAEWFCVKHWKEYSDIFVKVEDRRELQHA